MGDDETNVDEMGVDQTTVNDFFDGLTVKE